MRLSVDEKIHTIVNEKLGPVMSDISTLKVSHDNLSKRQQEISLVAYSIQENTEALVKATIGAGKVALLIKKHGPRLFAFTLGILVSSGLIDPELASHIRGFFGL